MKSNLISDKDLELMYKFIPEDKLYNTLNFIINRDYIKKINEYIHELTLDSSVFPYLVFNLYFENISVNDLLVDATDDKLKEQFTILKDIFNSFVGIKNSKFRSLVIKDLFIRDYIKNIYYSKENLKCYGSLNNIKMTFSTIWNDLTTEEIAFINILGCNTDNFYKFFYRINDNKALCEDIIASLSYVLNYDKYYIEETVYSSDFHYIKKELLNSTSKLENKKMLESIFNKISARTIHY